MIYKINLPDEFVYKCYITMFWRIKNAFEVPAFLKNYEEYKRQIRKIDYSDMLQIVINKHIPLDTPVLMVDEFQDFTSQIYKIF